MPAQQHTCPHAPATATNKNNYKNVYNYNPQSTNNETVCFYKHTWAEYSLCSLIMEVKAAAIHSM